MFATKENQRLYLPAWEYNAARVLGAMTEIIAENGGKVKPWKHIMANNRTYEPDAEPRQIYGQSWITFVIDGVYYYFGFQDNPFFEDHFVKTPVHDGKRLRNVYADTPLPGWKYDCLFRVATDAQCAEIAEELLGNMRNAEFSKAYHERHRIRVRNTYDGGYHYEFECEPNEYVNVEV